MNLKTLNRYIGREFLKLWLLCLSGFFLLFVLVDFIERSRHLFKYGANYKAIFLYFLYKSPWVLYMIMPVSVLMGTLLTLAILSKNSEITAIKACGISVLRAVSPIIILATVISVGTFLMNEFIVPVATQQANYVYKTGIKKQKKRVKYKRKKVWYKAADAIYRFDLFIPDQDVINGVELYRFDDKFNLTERTKADKAKYFDQQWHFLDGAQRLFQEGKLVSTTAFEDRVVQIPETPDELKIYQKVTEEMSLRELRSYVVKMKKEGYDATRYIVDMHGKISFPLVSIIMAILGIPFAIRHGRSGGIAAGIGIAVILGVIYWIVLAMMLAFGHSGAINTFVAAWGTHILFGIAGIVMLIRTEK